MSALAYGRAIEAARAVALGMTQAQAEAFRHLLESYAEELATRVAAGLATGDQRRALAIAREIIQQLTRDLAISTRNGVVVTSERVARIYAEATAAIIDASGQQLAVGITTGIGARAAQALLARPELAAAFRSIQHDSIAAVDGIIRRAVLRGASSSQFGKELRLHILGADAFPVAALVDRRRIGYQVIRGMGYEATPANLLKVRKDAGLISNRAQLIARTEPMNAEWEVHRQGAIESSVVKSIRWKTSRRHAAQDECDVLAEVDLFGLGPGTYDPRMLPRRPHPRCICLQLDVLLDPEEWGKERGPLPQLQVDLDQVASAYGLRPSQSRSLQSVLNAPPAAAAGSASNVQATPGKGPKIPVPPPTTPAVPSPQTIAKDLRGKVRKRESQIAPLPVEWATGWDPNTAAMILNKTDNLPAEVSFTPAERKLLKDAVMTHNHPSSSSFSHPDVGFAIGNDLAEIRATSVRYDHSLVRPAGGWPDANDVLAESYKVAQDLENQAIMKSGGYQNQEEWLQDWHRHWRRVFAKFKVTYRRTKHTP